MNKIDFKILTNYILSFNSLDNLNTDLIEDWAIELINLGHESDAVFMLASFSKPIIFHEVDTYLKNVFRELNLEEKDRLEAQKSFICYHLNEIVNSKSIRHNLRKIIDLYYNCDSNLEITDFYLLYYAWDELDEIGVNYYYKNVDLDTIEKEVIKKALLWIDNNL